ncbi:unnamed protein product [Mytilus edulis]|uniref:Reverse transcriptase domain-containing protein n=1 Tax=Mytilus edulis TaxID=6550 RepID=A0A8S3RP34_MYTED|nr:unnamed protein product [Mytilus edulis]
MDEREIYTNYQSKMQVSILKDYNEFFRLRCRACSVNKKLTIIHFVPIQDINMLLRAIGETHAICNHPSTASICRDNNLNFDAHHKICFLKKTYTNGGIAYERGGTNETMCKNNAAFSSLRNPDCKSSHPPVNTVCYDCCIANCPESRFCNQENDINPNYMPSYMQTGPGQITTTTLPTTSSTSTTTKITAAESTCRTTSFGIDVHHVICFLKKTYTNGGITYERGGTDENMCMKNAAHSSLNNPDCKLPFPPVNTVCYDCCYANCPDSRFCNQKNVINPIYIPSYMHTGLGPTTSTTSPTTPATTTILPSTSSSSTTTTTSAADGVTTNITIIDDKSEEEKREANVIIFGIPETEEGDSKMKDTEFIQGLCSDSLGVDNIDIDEITRLGVKPKKGSGKFRLTRLVVKDNTSRNNLFRNAYKLKDTKIGAQKKVGKGRDLIKKQKEINNALRIELGQMKKDFPHRSLAIRREKIVEQLTVSVDNFVPVNSYVTVTVNDNTNELNISQGVSVTQSVKEEKKFTSKGNMKSLRVLFSNVDTLSNKRSEFEAHLSIEKPHIIGLCKIYPKNSMDKSIASMLNLADYKKYLPDKVGDRGVVIYIHKSLTAFKVDILSESGFNESVWCEVKLEGTDKLLFGCIYRSPSSVSCNNKKLNDLICHARNLKYSHYLIMGDFNYPEIKWVDNEVSSGINTDPFKCYELVNMAAVPGRSCVSQLLEVLDEWSELIDSGFPLDSIFLDFSKAFDTVPHQRLFLKLEKLGIKGCILNGIKRFLSGRKQCIRINNTTSTWPDPVSGVPQESVLGPVLFLTFINDLPDVVEGIVKVFADNCKVYPKVSSDYERCKLQDNLDRLCESSDMWKM